MEHFLAKFIVHSGSQTGICAPPAVYIVIAEIFEHEEYVLVKILDEWRHENNIAIEGIPKNTQKYLVVRNM